MPHAPLPRRVRFGRFELDAVNADLRKDGRRIRLRPQALTLLALLVDRAGTLVTREEVRLALWPEDTFVDFDHGLNATIAEVRRVLGDAGGRGRVIETVPRRGYRFVAPVDVVDASQWRRRQSDQTPTPDTAVAREAMPAPLPMAASDVTTHPDSVAAGRHQGEAAPAAPGRRMRRAIVLLAAAACLLLAVQSMADYLPWRSTSADPAVPVSGRRGGTSNPVAWQAYSRARVYWSTRSECARATVEYREAARLDPAFALPWVGIADCFTVAGNRAEAQAALAQAERRAPHLGEVHASRGFIRMFLSWDWAGAEESFAEAMRQAPEYASAWQWAGLLSLFRGDVERGHARLTRAAALEPASAVIATDLAWAELARGRPQEALSLCRQAQRLAPRMLFNPQCLAAAWQRLGRSDEVWAVYAGEAPRPGADHTAGLRTHYERELAGALSQPEVPAHTAATYYAALGNTERALYWLESAIINHQFMVPFTTLDPRFDDMRRHPKFRELMDRVGLATGEPHS